MTEALEIVAMHGWCGDRHSWDAWLPAWQARGWHWCCGERGYGGLEPLQPRWRDPQARKVVIAHSLGPHLLPAAVLNQADAVILLASFGRFVPEGRAGRAVQAALAGMARELWGAEPGAMLRQFLHLAAAPASPELLQSTPLQGELSAAGLQRLGDDLDLITASTDLPQGFPAQARVLLVQAGADQIVVPETRLALELCLPDADVLRLARAGHALIGMPVLPLVTAWIEQLLPCP